MPGPAPQPRDFLNRLGTADGFKSPSSHWNVHQGPLPEVQITDFGVLGYMSRSSPISVVAGLAGR
jgi:hypothetical protein